MKTVEKHQTLKTFQPYEVQCPLCKETFHVDVNIDMWRDISRKEENDYQPFLLRDIIWYFMCPRCGNCIVKIGYLSGCYMK